MEEFRFGSYIRSPLSTAELDLYEWREKEKKKEREWEWAGRSHLLFGRVLDVARRNNGKTRVTIRARHAGAPLSAVDLSHSLKSLLRPIRHAYWLYTRPLHLGKFARAIIDKEKQPCHVNILRCAQDSSSWRHDIPVTFLYHNLI